MAPFKSTAALLKHLKATPETVAFPDALAAIEADYEFTPKRFSVGTVVALIRRVCSGSQ